MLSVTFELPSEMEYFDARYCRLNRILLSTIGLWPYDNFRVRHFRFILSVLILISFTSAQLIKLYVSEYNFDLLLNILSINIACIITCIRCFTFYASSKNVKKIRECIRNNWSVLTDNREIEIICKQETAGMLFTIYVIVSACAILFICIFVQYSSVLFDIVIPLNESRPRKLLFPAEYFIDQQKYFYAITIYVFLGLLIVVMTIISTETFIFVNALHAFGLFKITNYRMKNMLNGINSQKEIYLSKKYAISYNAIFAAVDFHRRAFEFSDLLKASFGQIYLVMLLLGVWSASISLLYLSRLVAMEKEILEIIIYVLIIVVQLIYFTVGNYAGQEFINCDRQIYRTICNTKWYDAPLKIQKLVLFLIQRTTKCYRVDAAGMFSPSLEGFTRGLSMSISYFMVLRSI